MIDAMKEFLEKMYSYLVQGGYLITQFETRELTVLINSYVPFSSFATSNYSWQPLITSLDNDVIEYIITLKL